MRMRKLSRAAVAAAGITALVAGIGAASASATSDTAHPGLSQHGNPSSTCC